MHKLDGAGQRGIKEQNTRNFRVDLIQCSQPIVCSLRMPHKRNKKLQEILMTKRPETTRLMQQGGKYFE